MKEKEVKEKLIKAVETMYETNKVYVKRGQKTTNKLKITKGLLQGCSTSPTLFKIYIEETLTLEKEM